MDQYGLGNTKQLQLFKNRKCQREFPPPCWKQITALICLQCNCKICRKQVNQLGIEMEPPCQPCLQQLWASAGRSGEQEQGGDASLSSLSIHAFLFISLPLSDQRSCSGKSQAGFKKATHEHRSHEKRESPAEMTPAALAPGQEKCQGTEKGQWPFGWAKHFSDNLLWGFWNNLLFTHRG